MNFRIRIVFFICTLIATHLDRTVAQSDSEWNDQKTKKLDSFLESLNERKQFNGAVLIAEDGQVVYEKSLGIANPKTNRRLGPESSFRLASVSKQFTAMGIMILKEQEKLGFDDDIREYLPELNYEGITIRHLLNHTGGLPDYMDWFTKNWDTDSPAEKRKPIFNKDLVEQFGKHQPEIEFEPGEKYQYSNTGYVLLGKIIEEAAGQPIQKFFQQRVFDPLEMTNSAVFKVKDFELKNRVYGFVRTADGFIDNDWTYLNGVIGDGGIYASARDLLKWDQALYTEKLVKQSTLDEAFRSGKTNDGKETGYGFGWKVKRVDGELVNVSHMGGWVGFRTFIMRQIQEKRTAIFLTNNSSSTLPKLMQTVRKIQRGENVDDIVKAVNAPRLKVQELEKLVGRYRLSSDFAIAITRKKDQLFGQATGQSRLELIPMTATKFSVVGVDAELSFQMDKNGSPRSLTLHQGGVEQVGIRID